MKTLILLTALAAIASAGPAFLGKDGVEEPRLNGVFKTIKRDTKSAIQESPSDLSSDLQINSETLPSNIARGTQGFRKPIIVKKKFGYHIYRDSDEELAQSEPRENCRRQFRFKLCDEGDQISNSMRSLNTEDIDETDVQQSLKMAKEAVEILQRDLQKIERNSKLSQKHHQEEKLEDELHKKAEEPRRAEHLSENLSDQDPSLWKTITSKSEETRMAEWKEAIENIQKNVEIAKNIEDTLKSSEHSRLLSEEELDLSKPRKANSVESTNDSNLLTKDMKIENNHDSQAKIPEENMETYATENKDLKVSLTSENLKVEKDATDLMHHVVSKMSLNEEKKIQEEQDDTKIVQGKSANVDLQSTHNLEEKLTEKDNLHRDIISKSKTAQDLEEVHLGIKELPKTDNLDMSINTNSNNANEKSATLDKTEERTLLRSSMEVLELSGAEKMNKAVEVLNKAGLETEDKSKTMNLINPEIKDAATSESRILVKAENPLIAKEANVSDLLQKKESTLTHSTLQKSVDAGEKTITDLSKEKLAAEESELRTTHDVKEDTIVAAKETLRKSIRTDDLLNERSEMREAIDDSTKQVISSNISEARSVESEQNQKLFDRRIHDDKKAKSVSEINSESKVEPLNKLKVEAHATKTQKVVDIVHEKQQHNDDLKFRKVQESFDNEQLQNKLEKNNRDLLHESDKLRLVDPSADLHGHSSDSIIDLNTPSMKMSEMDYYNNLNSLHSAQLSQDNNIDFHSSAHIKDTVSNWNQNNYQMHDTPYMVRGWPQHDRFRSDPQLDSNQGALGHIHHHHHPGNIHFEDDSHHFIPTGRFVDNPQGNKHELLNTMRKEDVPESGRESEWDAAMQSGPYGMHMHMRDALDKNGTPFGYRHAGFGSSIPLVGPTPSGSGAVGLFPNSNGGCGIPLLLSCSPSVVSGSLAKSHSMGFNGPAYRSNDNMRFHTKRDANILDETPAVNVKTFSLTSP